MRSRIPAAMALAATLVFATSAQAFEVKHAEGGELVRWRRPGVAWTVDRSVKEVPGAEAAVTAAIAAWTQQSGAPKLSLAAKGGTLKPGLDGTNGIFYAKDGYAPAGRALAITVLSFDDLSGEVLDADIILNGKYELGTIDAAMPAPTTADERGAETYDIGRVLAHEMGHALALSDEPARKDALMYPYVPRAKVLSASPGTDDLAGLETLYADVPEGADSAAAAGCSGSGTTPGSRGGWCAVGLSLSAIVLARKRRAAAGLTTLVAVALLAPSSARAATTTTLGEGESIVTEVQTTASNGIFQSEISVITDGVRVSHHAAWGGTVGGIRQIVGGAWVPRAGERVRIVVPLRGTASVARLAVRSAE